MAVFFVQRPADCFVQGLDGRVCLFGDVAEDGVCEFGLVVAFFAFADVFGGHATFGEIDVAWLGEGEKCVSYGCFRGFWCARLRSRQSKTQNVALSQHVYIPAISITIVSSSSPPVPLSLSTLNTTTTSFLPTRINF